MIQYLRFSASNAGGTGSISGQGTKIPQATGTAKTCVYIYTCKSMTKTEENLSIIQETSNVSSKGVMVIYENESFLWPFGIML